MFDADEIILQACVATKTLEKILKTWYRGLKTLLLTQLLQAIPRFSN